jgi:KDO2-lipid IV(A) lauroyltransferase
MKPAFIRLALTVRRGLKTLANAIIGWIAIALLQVIRRGDRVRFANAGGAFLRRVGPWLRKHRVGRANLAAAFPDKTAAEIEQILGGVWDNLGRFAVEIAFLDRMRVRPDDHAPDGYYDQAALDHFEQIRSKPVPTAFFTAHLANWEISALAAARLGVDLSVLYRAPNVRAISDAVLKMRAGCMGTLIASGFDAPLRLAGILQRGRHVGMLVDQHDHRGVDVTFFGRTCKASPLLAQLARHTDCQVRGVRIVRLADGNHFRGEVTAPLVLPRDAEGLVDMQATMQAVTSVIEGWVREHPEQWLWLHRRWR